MFRFRSTAPNSPLGQDLAELAQQGAQAANAANAAAGQARVLQGKNAQLEQYYAELRDKYLELARIVGQLNVQGRTGDPNIQRVENIPGRRVPFDYTVDIAVPAGSTSTIEGSISITQEGPFVAVARYATFISQYQFQYTTPETTSTALFNGRSYGRYRPVHSAYDTNDGQPVAAVGYAVAFPGTGSPHITSPSNEAAFRSMEMDFRILMREGGSSFPRSYDPVPSSMWVKGLGEPFPLGALDFFERGEVIRFSILPMHQPNPAYGNISGFAAGNANYPFIDSQWDAIEGINDQAQGETDTDPVVRLPNGILTIGFHGYRIIQPAGAGQY